MRASLCAILFSSASSVDVRGRVSIPPTFPATGTVASSSLGAALEADGASAGSPRVHLDGGARVAIVSRDGAFVFEGVAPGLHALDVFSRDAVFPSYTVSVDAEGAASVHEFRYPGAPAMPAAFPLDLAPVAPAAIFEERAGSPIYGLLKSPLAIMFGVMALLMLWLQNQDDQTKAQVAAEQKNCAVQ